MHREGLGMANLLVGMTENDTTVNSHCNNSKQHLGLSAMDPVLTLQLSYTLKIGSTQIAHLHITVMARSPVFI